MDIIFYNGKINTLDGSATECTAVGTANGLITALGSDEDLPFTAGVGEGQVSSFSQHHVQSSLAQCDS